MSWTAGDDPNTWVPIPKPPFLDVGAEKAALGAVLARVTWEITGQWPSTPQLVTAIDALHGGKLA